MAQFSKRIIRFGTKKFLTTLDRLAKGLGWRLRSLYDRGLYRFTIMRRRRLRSTVFVGVTGSVGKSTAKDLIAGILERHLSRGRKNPGSLNWPEDMARLVLGTHRSDAFCVVEMSGHGPGAMDLPLRLVQPTVGVVTSIGSDHLTAFKSREAIAQEKGKLISSLPPEGIAVLNADDPRVLAMQSECLGRTVTYGIGGDAMLRGDAIQSVWPDRLSLTAHWQGESVHVRTQLCGTHWAPVVLAALATGVSLGVPLTVAAEALAGVEPFEGRMAPVVLNGITFIRDDWKAPLSTVEPAFEFMRQANAIRKLIVIGTISDYQGDSTSRYVEIGRLALEVADCVVFVGPRASASLRAKRNASDELRAFASLRDASAYFSSYLKPGDLVLLKGSHKADHMQRLIVALTTTVQCWRSDCGRMQSCETCDLLHVPSGAQAAEVIAATPPTDHELMPVGSGLNPSLPIGARSTVFVIGLGNPAPGLANTPHNVGYRAVDLLAQRLAVNWSSEGDLAMVARGELLGLPICLVKILKPMNEIGPALLRLARDFAFEVHQCILVHDDLDLPVGAVRARMRGSDGGHRGVRSILQAFQDDKFRRVKIGVGQPNVGELAIDRVLRPFEPQQHAAADAANRMAADRVVKLIRQQTSS